MVTGADGFIGRLLVYALRRAGYEIIEFTSRDGDVTNPATFERVWDVRIDFVFHLAARIYVPDAWNFPAEFQRVNVMGTQNVLDLCRLKKIPLTYVSAYIYGIPNKLPICEYDRAIPNNPYAQSKLMAESLCSFYAQFYDVPVTIIRPFNIFGPGQKPNFLIPEIISQALSGDLIRLKDLSPRRDYIYVDDLIAALILTLNIKAGCEVYNIGSGFSLSVSDIVSVIQYELKTSVPILEEGISRLNEIPDVYADISKARKKLNWHPRISFNEGIRNILVSEGVAR